MPHGKPDIKRGRSVSSFRTAETRASIDLKGAQTDTGRLSAMQARTGTSFATQLAANGVKSALASAALPEGGVAGAGAGAQQAASQQPKSKGYMLDRARANVRQALESGASRAEQSVQGAYGEGYGQASGVSGAVGAEASQAAGDAPAALAGSTLGSASLDDSTLHAEREGEGFATGHTASFSADAGAMSTASVDGSGIGAGAPKTYMRPGARRGPALKGSGASRGSFTSVPDQGGSWQVQGQSAEVTDGWAAQGAADAIEDRGDALRAAQPSSFSTEAARQAASQERFDSTRATSLAAAETQGSFTVEGGEGAVEAAAEGVAAVAGGLTFKELAKSMVSPKRLAKNAALAGVRGMESALGADASGGHAAGGLDDTVGKNLKEAAKRTSGSVLRGRSVKRALVQGGVEALDNDAIRAGDHAWQTASDVKHGVKAIKTIYKARHMSRAAAAAKTAAAGAKAAGIAGSELAATTAGAHMAASVAGSAATQAAEAAAAEGFRASIKKFYAQRLSRMFAKKAAGEAVVEGTGIAAKLKGALQAFLHATKATVKGVAGKALALYVLPMLAALLFAFGIMMFFFTGGGAQDQSSGTLTGDEAEIAQVFLDAGYSKAVTAGILGNIFGESSFNPTAEYHGESNNTLYEYGFGLFGLTDVVYKPGSGLRPVSNFTNYKNWCEENGKDYREALVQCQYMAERLKSFWGPANYLYKECSEYRNDLNLAWDSFVNSESPEDTCYMYLVSVGKPAAGDWAFRYKLRAEKAREFYESLQSDGISGGQEYKASSEAQQAVVNAANRTGSPGPHLCLAWVNNVFANAGYAFSREGNAATALKKYAPLSGDRSTLKVGMMIGCTESQGTYNSKINGYDGHIGIYVGDGLVRANNSGVVSTMTIEAWERWLGWHSELRWGFPPGME